MRVVQLPPITFRCRYCSAVNEGEPSEFREQRTMPPSYLATCGFCQNENVCFPTPLVARAAAAYARLS